MLEDTNSLDSAQMQLLKEGYARKRIHNGCLVRIENSITRVNCSASHGMPRDTKELPFWRNFQSAPHNQYSYKL